MARDGGVVVKIDADQMGENAIVGLGQSFNGFTPPPDVEIEVERGDRLSCRTNRRATCLDIVFRDGRNCLGKRGHSFVIEQGRLAVGPRPCDVSHVSP